MVGQILFADVSRRDEVSRDVLRHPPHQSALVKAREDRAGRARRLVILRFTLRHTDEEERQRLQQLLTRQHLTVKELHRILVLIHGRVGQAHVVRAEVLLLTRVGGSLRLGSVRRQIQEGMLEDFVRVIAGHKLRHGVLHVLIRLMFQLQVHDWQAIEVKDEINLVVHLPKVEVRTEGDAVLFILGGNGTCGGTRLRIVEPKLQPPHRQALPEHQPQRRVL